MWYVCIPNTDNLLSAVALLCSCHLFQSGQLVLLYFAEGQISQVKRGLSPALMTDCHSSETTVTLPVDLLRQYQVSAVTLDEPMCKGHDNGTHLVLKIQGTELDKKTNSVEK